ncbi:MAG: Maf family protein [Roseburia sp.]|nr:Maf family protein [Roseburia sp.]
MKILLASASPRRRELLRQIGLEFEIRVSNAEETITSSQPSEAVERLSMLKAKTVAESLSAQELEKEPYLVIGADTVVICDGRILGKPGDKREACDMLKRLQGRKHQVYTGIALLLRGQVCRESVFHEVTTVEFYPVTDEEIRDYVDTLEPMDKAGAYGIQGIFARYIKGIQGDYNNVVGLPVGRLYQELKSMAGGLGYAGI